MAKKKKAPKRVKAPREEGRHYIYKASGTKAPTAEKWIEHFFGTYGIVCEQDAHGHFHCVDRQVELLRRKRGESTATKSDKK